MATIYDFKALRNNGQELDFAEFKGKVLGVKRPLATGAGHHSVIRVGEDDWRICYHRRPIPSKGPHHRVVCIDRMVFDENGDIKPIEMTK